MSAAEREVLNVKVASCMASEQPWAMCTEDVSAKVLSVDEDRHSVEFLFKIVAGANSGRHRHTCETSVLILEGKIKNLTTGIEFGPGDFFYQPYNDEHVEEILEETIIYGSYRGDQEKLVEFYDEDGEVCGEFKVSDFAALLPQ